MGSSKYYRLQSLEKKEKSGRLKRKAALIFLVFAIGIVAWLLLFSPVFQINNIIIEDTGRISQTDISQLLDESGINLKTSFLNQILKPLKTNIFLVSGKNLASNLALLFPDLYNIKIQKKFFHTLAISSQERRAVGIWCNAKPDALADSATSTVIFEESPVESDCYYFDKLGIIFAQVPQNSGSLILKIHNAKKNIPKIGEVAIAENTLNFFRDLRENLQKKEVNIISFSLKDSLAPEFAAQTSNGFEIFIDPALPVSQAIQNFNTVYGKFLKTRSGNLAYVDLRMPDRIFYKLRGN